MAVWSAWSLRVRYEELTGADAAAPELGAVRAPALRTGPRTGGLSMDPAAATLPLRAAACTAPPLCMRAMGSMSSRRALGPHRARSLSNGYYCKDPYVRIDNNNGYRGTQSSTRHETLR